MDPKKFCRFLATCEKIYRESTKKIPATKVANALYRMLTENEDKSLVNLKLTRSEKKALTREYNEIFTDKGKNLFREYLNGRRSLTTA